LGVVARQNSPDSVAPGANPDEEVSQDDLSLEIPAEADRSVVDNLLSELPQLSGEFSEHIGRLLGGDTASLEPAQRIAHTLKGSANTVGIRGIANLTHQLEDILQLLGAQQQQPRGALKQILEDSADCLAEMAEAVAGLGAAPENALDVYQATIQWTNRLVAGEMPADEPELAMPRLRAPVPSAEPQPEVAPSAPSSEAEAMLRVPLSLVDRLLDLAGESAMLLARAQNETGRMSGVHQSMRDGSDRLIDLANELERLVDLRSGTMQSTRRATPMETLNAMRLPNAGPAELVAEQTFDALEMEEYNELHTVARRIAEAGADQKLLEQQVHASVSEVANTIAALEAIQMQLRDVTLQTRMVAVSTVAPRMARAVRQTARMVGKQVELEISGEATLVDNELLQSFLEPLMHLLRNAVDHGIESVSERLALGKSDIGQVTLAFSRVGSNLRIVCEDDGSGMDLGKIRARAVERGLLGAEDECSERDLCRMILQPGFSTRDVASQVSGRGIGLDVVAQAVRQMRGSIDISTRLGAGSRFELQLPLRLSSVPVIVARSATHTVGLALRGIEQIMSIQERSDDGQRFVYQEMVLPCLRLETLLGLPAEYFYRPNATEIVLVVRDDLAQLHAIVTPDLSQTQNVVLKPLSGWLGDIDGIEGAAVLGDGSVAPVCDLPELLSMLRRADQRPVQGQTYAMAPSEATSESLPVCLIVDDSVSVRRTMELFVRDLGFQPEAAGDGLDALGKLQKVVPAIMLVDLEMPRMNGVELTASVRQDARLKDVPIIMITSRYTDKHKAMALGAGVNTFMTKPYTEDELASHIHKLILR
jgi:chemotaxis protein histidine kinase CheA